MKHYWDSPFEIPNILNQIANSPLFKKFTDSIAKKLLSDTIIFNNIASSQSFADNYTAVNNRRKFFEQQYYSKSLRIFKNLKNDAVLQEFINNKVEEKSELFKTIPKDLAENIVPLINQWNVQGLTSKEMSKQKLPEHISSLLEYQVRRIARTETSKTSVDIIEFKSKKCNVPCYIWRASGGSRGDGRTRDSHKKMADVIVFWNDPPAPEDLFPIIGENGKKYKNTLGNYHAGCCPNCRCVPSPVIFKDDLKFPVRVYTNGKIVSMQKPEFDNLYNSRTSQMKAELQREKEQAEQKKNKEELPKEKEIKTSEEKNITVKEHFLNPSDFIPKYYIQRNYIDTTSFDRDCEEIFFDNKIFCDEAKKLAKRIFKHREETNELDKEELYIMDSKGDIRGEIDLNNLKSHKAEFTQSQLDAIEDIKKENLPFVAIHNHPNNTPPSLYDFNHIYKHRYNFGLIFCHSGAIYKYYRPNDKIDIDSKQKEIEDKINDKYNSFEVMTMEEAYIEVYKEYGLIFERVYKNS